MSTVISLSDDMEKACGEILSNARGQRFTIKCRFYSNTNAAYSFNPLFITSIYIVQKFVTEYANRIVVELSVSPQEYIGIYNNSQDLWCLLDFVYLDQDTNIEQEPFLSITRRVIIKDKIDISKHHSPADIADETSIANNKIITEAQISNRVGVALELVEDEVYYARKKRLNMILKQATVEDAMLVCAKALGIEKVYIVPPNNTTVYDNLIIPPLLSIADVFGFLQSCDGYGVYDGGLGYYIDQGILYIYPLFDMTPESPQMVHIYKVPETLYIGMKGYHIENGNDIRLVSNTSSDDKDLIDEGFENTGNHYFVQPTDTVLENWRVASDKKFTISDKSLASLFFGVQNGMTSDLYTPVYKATENMHKLKAELISNYMSLVALGWSHAVPFTFKPGFRVLYHHDGPDGEYKKASGVCNSVIYAIHKTSGLETFAYTCSATIQLAVRYP